MSIIYWMDKDAVLIKIRLKRISLKLSQDDMAKAIKVTSSQYSKIETGKSDLTFTNLIKIINFLGLRLADLDDKEFELPSAKNSYSDLKIKLNEIDANIKKLLSSRPENLQSSAHKFDQLLSLYGDRVLTFLLNADSASSREIQRLLLEIPEQLALHLRREIADMKAKVVANPKSHLEPSAQRNHKNKAIKKSSR